MGVHSNCNELQPVRNEVYHLVCATSVRTVFCIHSPSAVFGGANFNGSGGLSPQSPLGLAPGRVCAGEGVRDRPTTLMRCPVTQVLYSKPSVIQPSIKYQNKK